MPMSVCFVNMSQNINLAQAKLKAEKCVNEVILGGF